MREVAADLFGPEALDSTEGHVREQRTGVLPYQTIAAMIRDHQIVSIAGLDPSQVQPASLDLRLGDVAYRVRASFLPGPSATVLEKVEQLDGYPINLKDGAVLEKGCVYVIPLLESLDLRSPYSGFANPKSSTGRLDILTRLITDRSSAFDQIQKGYKGPLYAEVAPRTFSVVARTGARLNQVRFRRGTPAISTDQLQTLHAAGNLVLSDAENRPLRDKLVGVTIDLQGSPGSNLIGFRAKKHTDRIDLEKVGAYEPDEFWERLYYHSSSSLILYPDDFYILATREFVRIPPDFAAEMVAYDTTVGEFRVHYAGFFDPGFGWDISAGRSKAVLEVRSHEVPFMLEHGQTVGWLRYEPMAARPTKLYGANIGSNYQSQGLTLAKQFRSGRF